MKSSPAILIVLFCFINCSTQEEDPFYSYFEDKTLRIDYFHVGDAVTENVELDELIAYEVWAGSLTNLIDKQNYGTYLYKLTDSESGNLIYSRGFDSYFKEYQNSSPAAEGKVKEFHESAILPFPKKNCIFSLDKRQKDGSIVEVFSLNIDPASAPIINKLKDSDVLVLTSQKSGDPHLKADIAIIGEGYSADDQEKFIDDLKRFTEVFFKSEPCKSYRDRFNVYGVLQTSVDSGVDEPTHGIFKNTALNATFNSMGSERYLLTEDNKALRDIAGNAPYDALYIMVNHSRYGGGGIYNFYCTYTSDNIFSEYLMVHEFGHSFFGLADEYYSSSTAYNDFYPQGYEPAEPNITALLDSENIKWKHLLTENIELPTPWAKDPYDSADNLWQTERKALNETIAALQSSGASEDSIKAAKSLYDEKSTAHTERRQSYLDNSPFAGQVGAFEGAGYTSKGMYRPSVNCIMFTKTDFFCPVCAESMAKTIDWYSN